MKKPVLLGFTLIAIIAVVLFVIATTCVPRDKNIELTTYEDIQSDAYIKPWLKLQEKSGFELFYAVESSYKAIGVYEIEGKKIFLKTSDEKYLFVFSIENKTLVFEQNDSTLPPDFINIKNKDLFVPANID